MMEAQYKTQNGRLIIKVQAESQRELFRQIAAVQDIFDTDTSCGLCQFEPVRFQVRTVEGNEYFELQCPSCGAQFKYGQHKNTPTLFAKRRTEDGAGGWKKWQEKEMP